MKYKEYEYLAIDWSGANPADGIAVAALEPGSRTPELLPPPDGKKHWKREDVLCLLQEQAKGGAPTVAGIDCNFALPFIDRGEYLPGMPAAIAHAIWAEVESVCSSDPDFYGGAFSSTHDDYFLTSGTKNYKFRFRATEKAARAYGVKPQSPFNLAQRQAQVGKGGLAGMRMLNRLKEIESVAIWPFDEPKEDTRLTVVEIFPTLHRCAAGVKGNGKINSRTELDEALYNLECLFTQEVTHSLSGDDTDALISAAGMARAPDHPCEWMPPGLDRDMLQAEGWIFGVGTDWIKL